MNNEQSMLSGDIEEIHLETDPQGGKQLTFSGWLLCLPRRVLKLRFALPGSPMITAEQIVSNEAFKLAPKVGHSLESGFRVSIPIPENLSPPLSIYFLASLTADLTLAGSFPVPDDISQLATATDLSCSSPQPASDYDRLQLLQLAHFTSHDGLLSFSSSPQPEVSIIVPIHKRPERVLACLRSIAATVAIPYELILVNNDSGEPTASLLSRIQGATIINNRKNFHYIKACNQAAEVAAGQFLLFLNSDTEVLPGAVSSAVNYLQQSELTGAVGGRLIRPDASLQEAGSIVFNDGSCCGYGRGDDPNAAQYLFERRVDYCSGAFLCTPARLYREHGGFSDDYQPAYYEDVDYCLRLQQNGYQVRYLPTAALIHAEFSSSPSRRAALELQVKNRGTFLRKNRDFLRCKESPAVDSLEHARFATASSARILLVDDTVPLQVKGSGLPRAKVLLKSLDALGLQVTLLPAQSTHDSTEDILAELPAKAEILQRNSLADLVDHLRKREGYYDLLWISRPHTMEHLTSIRGDLSQHYQSIPVVFDVEAMYSLRELSKLTLANNQAISLSDRASVVNQEVVLAKLASAVITVNQQEADEFRTRGHTNIHLLSHGLNLNPTSMTFAERNTILTVGPVYNEETPNADALNWFVTQVHPKIVNQLPQIAPPFVAAGYIRPDIEQKLISSTQTACKFVGAQRSLSAYYEQCRVFVAATRYCSGISLKTLEAAACGVPVVATSLVANQLGWQDRRELLVADSAEQFAACCVELFNNQDLWQKIRVNALRRIAREYSEDIFRQSLRPILQSVLPQIALH